MAAADDEAQRIAAQAADWIVRLSAGDAEQRAATEAAFAAWCQADARHAAAAAALQAFIDGARQLGGRAEAASSSGAAAARHLLGGGTSMQRSAQALTWPSRRRRWLLPLLGLSLSLVLLLGWAGRDALSNWAPADLRTAVGEQREERLSDGSRLLLAGDSRVNLRLDAAERRVELLAGELLVDVSRDPARPFVVETAEGRVRVLGTRFILRQGDGVSWLTMLESRAAVRGRSGAEQIVAAGERLRLAADGIEPLPGVDAALVEQAFRQRRLLVQDRPLAEVLDELARQRRGLIRYDAQAIAAIRVTAVLPLDDVDAALQLLQTSFPQLRVRRFTPWLLLVGRGA